MLAALRLDADRLPTPRADGDREALRILLGARQEMTTASTAQTNRLRALLLGGDDTDRQYARDPLTDTRLAGLARRRPPREASREQAVRHAEIRRLALALRAATRELQANRAQLQTIVNDVVPGLIERRGIGPVVEGGDITAAMSRCSSVPAPDNRASSVRTRGDRGEVAMPASLLRSAEPAVILAMDASTPNPARDRRGPGRRGAGARCRSTGPATSARDRKSMAQVVAVRAQAMIR